MGYGPLLNTLHLFVEYSYSYKNRKVLEKPTRSEPFLLAFVLGAKHVDVLKLHQIVSKIATYRLNTRKRNRRVDRWTNEVR